MDICRRRSPQFCLERRRGWEREEVIAVSNQMAQEYERLQEAVLDKSLTDQRDYILTRRNKDLNFLLPGTHTGILSTSCPSWHS